MAPSHKEPVEEVDYDEKMTTTCDNMTSYTEEISEEEKNALEKLEAQMKEKLGSKLVPE